MIRPSRSHESLATSSNGAYHDKSSIGNRRRLTTITKKTHQSDDGLIQNCLKLNEVQAVNSTHNSILNQDNCFEIKYKPAAPAADQLCKYFLCRSTDERDKWLYILKHVINQNYDHERRTENTLQLCLLEAKGNGIQQSQKKKYFCEILINNCVHARTCLKDKKDILFWGENFDFQ
jgi:hypothetical protein